MGFVFNSFMYVTGYVILGLEALLIASGLYLAAELIEEALTPMRKFIEKALIAMLVLHIILWLDGCQSTTILIGIVSHASYFPMLKNFPYVNVLSPKTWIPLILLLVNHFSWFGYFIDKQKEKALEYNRYGSGRSPTEAGYDFMSTCGFLLVFVWFVPLCFFISVMDVEEALPSSSLGVSSISSSGGSSRGQTNDFYNYSANQSSGDGMLDYQNDYHGSSNMSMQIPTGEYQRPKKGGLLKKFLDPLKAKKDMIFTRVAMPIRKDK